MKMLSNGKIQMSIIRMMCLIKKYLISKHQIAMNMFVISVFYFVCGRVIVVTASSSTLDMISLGDGIRNTIKPASARPIIYSDLMNSKASDLKASKFPAKFEAEYEGHRLLSHPNAPL